MLRSRRFVNRWYFNSWLLLLHPRHCTFASSSVNIVVDHQCEQCENGVVEDPLLPLCYSVACNINKFNMLPPREEAVPSPVKPLPPPPPSPMPGNNTRTKRAADEEAKRQFANAYRIYRKTVEAYLNATFAVRTMCSPYIDRVLRLKDHARDIDQDVLCAGIPEMSCLHQLFLLGLLLPPWCLPAVTVSARRRNLLYE
ncbi:hypothetical protein MRX96_034310 [Rhipicephalus microplus]